MGAEEIGADSPSAFAPNKKPLKTNLISLLALTSNASERWRGASLADGEAVAVRPSPQRPRLSESNRDVRAWRAGCGRAWRGAGPRGVARPSARVGEAGSVTGERPFVAQPAVIYLANRAVGFQGDGGDPAPGVLRQRVPCCSVRKCI